MAGGHWRHWAGSGGALGPDWSRGDAAALCVAGVALSDITLPFVWQAWHLETSNCHLRSRCGTGDTGQGLVARLDRIGRAVTPRHCGTRRHPPAICVAGVALGNIHLRWCGTWRHPLPFAWQVWHFVTHHLWHPLFQDSFTHHLCHTPSFTHPLSHPTLSHTIFDTLSFTHHFVTHHLWHTIFSHTTLSPIIFDTPSLSHTIFHTPLCHTPSLTLNSVTAVFHTPLCHTIFHTPSFTQLCHTPSFTHHFVTHHFVSHHLSHTTLSHTIFHLSHTTCRTPTLSHAPFHTQLSHTHTPSFTYHFVTHNCFNFSIFHHLLCLSFFPRPRYNIWCSLLEEVALWGLSGPLIFFRHTFLTRRCLRSRVRLHPPLRGRRLGDGPSVAVIGVVVADKGSSSRPAASALWAVMATRDARLVYAPAVAPPGTWGRGRAGVRWLRRPTCHRFRCRTRWGGIAGSPWLRGRWIVFSHLVSLILLLWDLGGKKQLPAESNGSITLDNKWHCHCKKPGHCRLIFLHQFCPSREGAQHIRSWFTPSLMHSHMVTSYLFLGALSLYMVWCTWHRWTLPY